MAEATRTCALAPDEKEKLVDQLVAAAKERREKAAKQRAEGKADLADRTEAQARSLEVAADELNKQRSNEHIDLDAYEINPYPSA